MKDFVKSPLTDPVLPLDRPLYKKYACVYIALSIKLKFDVCTVDHCTSYYIDFGVNRIYSFFLQDIQNAIHYVR